MNVGFTTTAGQDLRQRYTADVHGSVFSTIVKTFLPVDRQERTLGHQTSFLSVVSHACYLAVMLADITIAVHDGRQLRVVNHLQVIQRDRPTVYGV